MTGFGALNGLLLEPRFLDRAECARIRRAMDDGAGEPAEIVGRRIVSRQQVRLTRSIEIESALQDWFEHRLDLMRPVIETALGIPLGSREGAGFLRYPPGGFYRTHRDRGDVAGWPDAARRAVSVVVFLNSAGTVGRAGDFEGGHLCLYRDDSDRREIVPEAGLLVAFLSDVLHEVLPVRNGVRDAGVDWFYDR